MLIVVMVVVGVDSLFVCEVGIDIVEVLWWLLLVYNVILLWIVLLIVVVDLFSIDGKLGLIVVSVKGGENDV